MSSSSVPTVSEVLHLRETTQHLTRGVRDGNWQSYHDLKDLLENDIMLPYIIIYNPKLREAVAELQSSQLPPDHPWTHLLCLLQAIMPQPRNIQSIPSTANTRLSQRMRLAIIKTLTALIEDPDLTVADHQDIMTIITKLREFGCKTCLILGLTFLAKIK